MPTLTLHSQLALDKCPHCKTDRPTLTGLTGGSVTKDYQNQNARFWMFYVCARCGMVVTAWRPESDSKVAGYFPSVETVDDNIPDEPRDFLQQASDCIYTAPAGSIMLSARGVDEMLKLKGFIDGTLFERIGAAAVAHVITPSMKDWAHKVRLDANRERHSNKDGYRPPTSQDADHTLAFAKALAQFVFVLPAMVTAGIKDLDEPKQDRTPVQAN